MTIDEFISKSNKIHYSKYDYSLVSFENNDSIIHIICPKHGLFKQKVSSHLRGDSCRKCSSDKRRTGNKAFIEKSNIIHNYKYDYSLVDYKSTNSKVKIICGEHGVFEKSPKSHIKGQGCPKCNIITNDKFISICKIKHFDKYDYSLTVYNGSTKKIKIICPTHGIFEQTASQHKRGMGCNDCGKKKFMTIDEFVELSKLVHNDKYDYSKSIYLDSKKKLIIVCPKHGDFSQIPSDHLRGHGCVSCGSEISISKLEVKWLDLMCIKNEFRQYKIGKYIVDGFDPLTNTIYEFNGDFWHGNPKKYNPDEMHPILNRKYSYLYKKTLSKERNLIKKGYKVVSIWESDYKEALKSQSIKS